MGTYSKFVIPDDQPFDVPPMHIRLRHGIERLRSGKFYYTGKQKNAFYHEAAERLMRMKKIEYKWSNDDGLCMGLQTTCGKKINSIRLKTKLPNGSYQGFAEMFAKRDLLKGIHIHHSTWAAIGGRGFVKQMAYLKGKVYVIKPEAQRVISELFYLHNKGLAA